MRLKTVFVSAFWRQNGANFWFSFALGAKTEPIIWLVRHEAPIRSQYRRRILLSFHYRNLRASKTTFFLKKFLHLVFAGALRSAGGLSSFSPSTPLPQHWEPKNDMEFEKSSKFFAELSSYPLNSHVKAPKTTSNLKKSHKYFERRFSGSERKKSACLFSEADALLMLTTTKRDKIFIIAFLYEN